MNKRKRTGTSPNSICPLTISQTKRKTADKLAAAVPPSLPSGLAAPALRALAGAGYTNLDKLSKVKEADVLKLHGMGPNAMKILRQALKRSGRSFK